MRLGTHFFGLNSEPVFVILSTALGVAECSPKTRFLRVFLGEAGRHSRGRCSLTYYCAVTSPRAGRPPCPVPTPPGGGDAARRARVGSAWASAPLLQPPALSARHATRPRPWHIPRTPAPAARAQTWGQKGPKKAKSGQNGPSGHAEPSLEGSARSSRLGLEADDRFWQESETSESTAKTCPKLPSTGADRSPPVRPKTGLSAWPKGQFRGK